MKIKEDIVFSNELIDKYEKQHDENKFWIKIKKVGTNIGVKPMYLVFLLYHSLMSKSISITSKSPIAGALGYFLSFIDIIPDLTPVLGYCDDVSVIMGALGLIATQITEKIREDAKNSTKKIFPNITEAEFKLIDSILSSDIFKHDDITNDSKV
ncbi:YkvA family protein [Paraclostridium sordellii]|uniref:YkvA family protein n=1 Tax=Paraclostridium sordellii TaxID=1505 RepID=UPI0005E2DC77|nr:DUF1232 domain-containing protein [Paeniclostridium sordellii]CEQ18973.1 Uncharacterized conserved protein [[Clostridium] sordellii] [Paeniclostridium sordellii]